MSGFLGQAVWDSEGQRVGKLVDLLASMQMPYPPIVALAVKRDREATILIP